MARLAGGEGTGRPDPTLSRKIQKKSHYLFGNPAGPEVIACEPADEDPPNGWRSPRLGTRLAAGCADNTIRLCDVATRQVVAELRGHTDYVHAVAFSPDGTRLVSGSGDSTVRIWDTLPLQVRAESATGMRGADRPTQSDAR